MLLVFFGCWFDGKNGESVVNTFFIFYYSSPHAVLFEAIADQGWCVYRYLIRGDDFLLFDFWLLLVQWKW